MIHTKTNNKAPVLTFYQKTLDQISTEMKKL